ncbi:TonB-dependent receptor [Porphyromonas pogonae]|uniref:TonB-dependent receptor n=1 Tax=Porphyromonas pogonae TaxID=867595 RepID=UPI002E761639|nr:TonB-dependent receptor [Porphyromonas pogonae]
MKRVFYFIVAMCMACSYAFATGNSPLPDPSDANIVGHVKDAKTGEHLVGITIGIKGTNYGTSTDASGHYFLRNLKPGKITLVMRGLGYVSQERTVSIVKDKTIEVNFDAIQDNVMLDEVVVSSNRQETLRRLAPTLVNVVDDKLFQKANVNNLSQGLIFQPGVRVENDCQNCGFNQVRINGLDGRYTQILIDSRPVMSSLAGVYGLEQIPANMIDRVEVVRGGGSALFGSSAIAGVVNIITKEPAFNSMSFNESATLTGFKNLDNNISFNGSMVSADSKSGASVFGQARYRNPWDQNDDGYSEIGRLDSRSLGASVYIKPTDFSKLSTELHTLSEDRRGGDHMDWPDHVAGVSEHVRHSVYSGNVKYDIFSNDYKHHFQSYFSGQYVKRNSFYGGIGEIEINNEIAGKIGLPIPKDKYGDNYGVTKGQTYNMGIQYNYDFDHFLFMPAQLLGGIEYTYDNLRDKMPIRTWESYKDKDGKIQSKFPELKQNIRTWSQLAQIEWKNEAFSFLLGARLDEVSVLDKPVLSPRATLRYNPVKGINLRATYAKGFRAPQVFDEDLHVGVVNGEAQKVFNADDLKPEVSHAFSLSSDMYFNFDEVQTNLLVEGFYTRILDVFTNNEQPTLNDGIMRFTRTNGDGAKVLGMNIEGRIVYKNFQLQGGVTFSSNKYDVAQEWGTRTEVGKDGKFVTELNEDKKQVYKNEIMVDKKITRTPSVYGYFTLGYNPVKPLNLSLTGTYTGSMYAPHVIGYGVGAAVDDRNAIAAGTRVATVDEEDNAPRIDELKKTPKFFDLGAKMSYDFKIFNTSTLQLYFGLTNIFNSFQKDYDFGPDRDSAYIYGPTTPRSGYAGIKYTF